MMPNLDRIRSVLVAAIAACLLGAPGSAIAESGPSPATVTVPAGPFITGSDKAEREAAYRLDEKAYGHSRTRTGRWYDYEAKRAPLDLPAFEISKNLVTNADYARFVQATGHRVPDVDQATWKSYGLVHPFERTRRHAWTTGKPPAGRENHPVVLISFDDAEAYAAWLSKETGHQWRLPSAKQWEKAARGTDGRHFPWGDTYEPSRLNSHDAGPFDTVPVGSFPHGASPFGLLDGAGQVFEWTSTATSAERRLVKGGSWDDKGCGVCRPAARHGRPVSLKHILIGFRLVRDAGAPTQ